MGLRLGHSHHLNEKRPARKISRLDRVEQVAAVAFAIAGDKGRSLGISEVLDSLLRAEMNLTQTRYSLAALINHRESVAALAVHVTEALRDAAVGHGDGDLVERIGQQRPEIQLLSALRSPVRGSRLIAWLRSGNRSGSRKKNTGVLLPTISQLPSSV
jgi:hypothetical protein